MQPNLLLIRVKSILWNLGSLVGMTIITALLSDDFTSKLIGFVQQHAGSSAWGAVFVLLVPEIVKAVRNRVVLGKATRQFGSREGISRVTLI